MPPRSIGEASRKGELSRACRLLSTVSHWLGTTKRQSEGRPRLCACLGRGAGERSVRRRIGLTERLARQRGQKNAGDREHPQHATTIHTVSSPTSRPSAGLRAQDSIAKRQANPAAVGSLRSTSSLGAETGEHLAAPPAEVIIRGEGGDRVGDLGAADHRWLDRVGEVANPRCRSTEGRSGPEPAPRPRG